MKSCFSPLQGARPRSAQFQLWSAAPSFICASAPMFTREEEEEKKQAEGWREAEEGWHYSKTDYTTGILCFCSTARETQLSKVVSSYQIPVYFIVEIFLASIAASIKIR